MSRNLDMRRSMLAELLEGQPITKKQKTVSAAPTSTLVLDGQRAYDEKRYTDAAEYFSQAIETMCDRRADLLQLYNLRSGAYLKIGQVDAALRDAKQMIRLDKADSRGYLRCAESERANGNLSGAIKICEHGLKVMASSSKERLRIETCLLRMRDVVKKNVIYEKGTDPMQVLPTELLDIVVASFTYMQAVAVMRVCKGWRARIRSTDILTHTVDTRESKRTIHYGQIKAAFARLGKSPKIIALANLGEDAARFVSTELSRWMRWETLEELIVEDAKVGLSRLRWDKLKSLRSLQTGKLVLVAEDVPAFLEKCKCLNDVSITGQLVTHIENGFMQQPPNMNTALQSLVLSFSHQGNLKLPNYCLFPNLRRFKLCNVSVQSHLDLTTYTKLNDLSLCETPISDYYNLRTPSGLQRFTLDGPFANIYPQPEELKMPAGSLETIDVKGVNSIRYLAYAIRQGLSNTALKHLSVTDFIVYGNAGGRHITSDLSLLRSIPGSEAFDKVEILALCDDNIYDHDVPVVNSLFPGIRHLSLEAPQVTEAFLSDLISIRGCQIRTVNLRNCGKIATEIVAWAKARGVEVSITRRPRPQQATGGRQVRHS